jgi:hypothetical protein
VYALPIDKIKYYRMQSPCDIYSRGHLSACGRCKISEPAVIFTSFPKFHSILLFVLITTQIKYSHYFRCFIYLFYFQLFYTLLKLVNKIHFCTGCPRMNQHSFNHELLASCRTRKKYLKNSISKNKMTFNF